MIKKLRIKFIITVIAMITVILAALLSTFFIFSKRSIYNESINALNEYSSCSSAVFDERFDMLFGDTMKYADFNIFVLEYNRVFNYIKPYGLDYNIDDEKKASLIALFNTTMQQDNDIGVIESYGMRYKRTYTESIVKIVYLDKTYEDTTISKLAVRIVIIGCVGWFAFLLIALLIARIAIKPVEESWKRQQRLVADVSHELKTPIAVIRSNIDIISSHGDETVAEQKKWIDYIGDEADRMSTLIGNMLYLAKSDDAIKNTEMKELDLSELCEEAILPFESICFEKGLTLEYTIEPGIRTVGSSDLLRQLIVIFMDNACKYSDPGKAVAFKLRRVQKKAVMEVHDYGKVIPPEDAAHLFERFYRADESRSQGGYGLGLSIAKTIIDAHDAKVSLESSETGGTAFSCTFKAL